MAHGGVSTAQATAGGPKAANAPSVQSESGQQREEWRSWWKNFKRSDKKAQEQHATQGIFGVPLHYSIRYANVAISLYDSQGQSYIYGYVPVVVAKCGVYLKEKATDVEGIFRLAGSEKRIKELKVAFDSPDLYGKGLDWTGYTVHDAANILRRYFNQLPEPIIPLDFYERFREPLRNHQAQAVGASEAQSPSVGHFDQDAAIRAFQSLITELPPLNRQLLLYVLDLLAVFASKSDLNKMTTGNLAAIFQPGMLSHPQHDMAPQEYRLSQDILIFLIDNQDSFLIGMQGTEADPETVRDVQSGTPTQQPTTPTTPSRTKNAIGRAGSNASAGAQSVQRWGSIRRNASVSSKHSKRSDGGPTPVGTPGSATPNTPTSGVHRSKTLPVRRVGSTSRSPRYPRDKTSDPPTPSPGMAATLEPASAFRQGSMQSTPIATQSPLFPSVPPTEVTSASSSEATTPMAAVGSDTTSTIRSDYTTPRRDTTPLLAPPPGSAEYRSERSASNTPSSASGRGFLDIFKPSPTSDSEGWKPNKLQKKRIPGSSLSSAQSSSHSLTQEDSIDAVHQSPTMPGLPLNNTEFYGEGGGERSAYATAHSTPVQTTTPQRTITDATLRPTASPTQSYHSTDQSDADLVGDDTPMTAGEQTERERKRHRFRFSRPQNKPEPPQTPGTDRDHPLAAMSARQQTASRSTMGSSNTLDRSRRSFQEAIPMAPVVNAADPAAALGTTASKQSSSSAAVDPVIFSDSEREQKKGGPMSWIRGKVQERRAKEAEKRAKTPERGRGRSESKTDLGVKQRSPAPVAAGTVGAAEAMPMRGKSMDMQRAAATQGQGQGQGQGRGQVLGQSGIQQAPVAEQVLAGPVPARQPAGSRMSGIAQAPLGQSPAGPPLTDGQALAPRDQARQSLTGVMSMGQTPAMAPAAPTAPTTTPLVPPTAEANRPLDGQGAADGLVREQ
ncbi:GTPase activating protein (GAP) for Rho1p [Friedmanniomyces endolithicus]|uniref:GTPase activating protein (GAP) for Rho1p n=1 Tax=Friedmanniomyces endolithicus TaxID=329885 RepID=A0AAN6K3M7_9PEZI|nr:GTPase activating protein (GAP) for Rho1p [Friedmanniomyces endolithicus]KAK0838102.1 GTPase activating protein (GAP) for Rho1p [Friedmanniomyces endolithicus]KAK0854662.1 GTPase activating protein (GAP) for Rho1p [Friedmanniomyces endolithicus]KAK0897594.1 GTPase activating protein (GAP) for Rho1p [Friedmanniomyces endolithicus]KAK0910140.1 GTPase activating protein (GAP) for Rho1p [Friedmanniomyces endolithicus]